MLNQCDSEILFVANYIDYSQLYSRFVKFSKSDHIIQLYYMYTVYAGKCIN